MKRHLSVIAFLVLSVLAACGSGATPETSTTDKTTANGGPGGKVGVSVEALCKIEDNGDGSKLITCDDGTSATVRDGVDGADGKNGAPGSPGLNGKDGADGLNGAVGSTGATGPKGDKGDQGLKGDNGDKGATGAAAGSPCPAGVIEGSYTAENAVDLAAILNCTDITGNLTVASPGTPSVPLPNLITVGGSLSISGAQITSVTLTSLQSARRVNISNTAITALALPVLTTASYDFRVTVNQTLASLSAPLLTTVVDGFYVSNNPLLPNCQATAIYAQITVTPAMFQINSNLGTCP